MSRPAAEQRLLRNSVITVLLGTALVWLPVINSLANQEATAPAAAQTQLAPGDKPETSNADRQAPAVPQQLLLTCLLANAGIAGLIIVNVRVNLRRLRQAADRRGEPPAPPAP
jgi:uncharacterized membrane protein